MNIHVTLWYADPRHKAISPAEDVLYFLGLRARVTI